MPETILKSGVRLHWREAGNPAGTPVLWIHGGSIEDSSLMTRDLEPWYGELRVLMPDARGHGLSQRFEDQADYSWSAKAQDLVHLLDELGVRGPVAWGGNSMGAALSLWAAIHHPARVRAVVDISGPPFATPLDEAAWWADHRPLVAAGRFADLYDANVAKRMGPDALAKLKARPERYAGAIRGLHQHSVPSFLALLDETYSRPDWLADCSRIACPTLVIGGSEDIFPTADQSRQVAATVPGAVLHIVEGGPHFPNRSHPHEVRPVIERFLRDVAILGPTEPAYRGAGKTGTKPSEVDGGELGDPAA